MQVQKQGFDIWNSLKKTHTHTGEKFDFLNENNILNYEMLVAHLVVIGMCRSIILILNISMSFILEAGPGRARRGCLKYSL